MDEWRKGRREGQREGGRVTGGEAGAGQRMEPGREGGGGGGVGRQLPSRVLDSDRRESGRRPAQMHTDAHTAGSVSFSAWRVCRECTLSLNTVAAKSSSAALCTPSPPSLHTASHHRLRHSRPSTSLSPPLPPSTTAPAAWRDITHDPPHRHRALGAGHRALRRRRGR